MNFQSVNPLNVRLNIFSGNLLPMSNDSLFPTAWRVYGAIVWIIIAIEIGAAIPAVVIVPRDKTLQNAGTINFVVAIEGFVLFIRMHGYRSLISRVIVKLNDMLRTEDKIMRNIVTATLKTVETPLEFYSTGGTISVIGWCSFPLLLILKRDYFFYEDTGVPVVFSKQPFSTKIFVLENLIVLIAAMYIFVKKVALDVYMINLVLLTTAQYRYTAIKLAKIFREGCPLNKDGEEDAKGCYSEADSWTEKELRALCRHHTDVIRITTMLKRILSMNMSLIYLNNVFRFCFLIVISIKLAPIFTTLQLSNVVVYICGNLTQFYILCLCVQQLLDASTEVTDKAFHEKWYQYGPSLKRTFMLMIISNNLACKLATFEKFNLSLSSYMTILNQSYSIALLFLRMK